MASEGAAPERARTSPRRERPEVVVLGNGVAGVTAAYELHREVGDLATIVLIADHERFVLGAALPLVPFMRGPLPTGFALGPALARHGVRFVQARAERIEPERRVVLTGDQEIPYDYLIIATEPRHADVSIPADCTDTLHAIHTEAAALSTRAAVERFLEQPGPAVVGLAQGAAFLSGAYEFVLQLDHALRRLDRREHATLAFITPEVHLGYLGSPTAGARRTLERQFARRRITVFTGAVVDHVDDGNVYLHDGTRLPARLALLMPDVSGIPAILRSAGLTDEFGFVLVDAGYRHPTYPEIYAAGVAARLQTPSGLPEGLPRTNYLASAAAKAVARNLAAAIRGAAPTARPLPRLLDLRILDGGDTGLLLLRIDVPLPIRMALPLPGRTGHWAKQALLWYLLWKFRTGRTYLP